MIFPQGRKKLTPSSVRVNSFPQIAQIYADASVATLKPSASVRKRYSDGGRFLPSTLRKSARSAGDNPRIALRKSSRSAGNDLHEKAQCEINIIIPLSLGDYDRPRTTSQ